MPQLVTNTMRVCIRDAFNASYDAAVPVRPRYDDDFGKSEERCSSTPFEVPWVLQDAASSENPAAQFSVGSVPMWDGTWSSEYPQDVYASQILNSNPGVSASSTSEEAGWGPECTESPLLECRTDADCPSVDPSTASLRCFRGACVLDMDQTGSCYAHRHCEAAGKMCSGDGVCAEPILQVENDLPQGEDVEFELYAHQCSSTSASKYPVRAYDTYGGSPWETVPDILQMYGMCSYRDWFEYLEFVDPTDASRANRGACGVRARDEGCDPASFNALQSLWWDVGAPFAETGMRTLFEMQKFRVKPHPCDRDYQHLENLRGCAPVMDTRNNPAAAGLVSHGGKALSDLKTLQDVVDFFASGNVKRAILALSDRYGTYAQTIRRDGYANMQGRPPFNYSANSPMRGSGFLSHATLLTTNGETVFQPCNTVKQCFMDTFTFRGQEHARRVLVRGDAIQATGVASFFRDWTPEDAAKCGIFGIWISDGKGNGINRKCASGSTATEETHYCCQVDMAVAPLHHLLYRYPEVLSSTLDPVCNRRPTLVSGKSSGTASTYPIFRFERVQSIVRQVGEFYAVPKNDVTKTVKMYMGLLNELLNEFSPPAGEIPTSHEYVQIVDCSVALYETMQSKLGCSSTGMDPMCADYHLDVAQSDEKQAKVPSLYYFLPNTMQEFPYAWWHKCVLLSGGRTIDGEQESIECTEWRQSTISSADMQNLHGLYDGEDVRSILRRVEGGVTSASMRAAAQQLKERIAATFDNFASSGVGAQSASGAIRSEVAQHGAEGTQIIFGPTGSMKRRGAGSEFNMKCYRKTFLPSAVEDFMKMGKDEAISCALNMLMWIKNENANFTRYDPKVSDPAYGKPGIQPECFILRDRDLVSLGGSSELKPVMEYIRERLEGEGSVTKPAPSGVGFSIFVSEGKGSLMIEGIEPVDFFDGAYNSNTDGLLGLEFVPPELKGLPSTDKDFSSVTGSMTSDMQGLAADLAQLPCVTLKDMEPELPECLPTKDDPVDLADSHCDAAYEKAKQDIMEYAERIDAEPTMSKEYRYPEPPQTCVWDCGGMWDGYERPAHAGLDDATRDAFLKNLEAWRTDCKRIAAAHTHCLRKSAGGSMQNAIAETRSKHYIQEVCGGYETDADRAMGIIKYTPWGAIANEIYEKVVHGVRYSDGINEYRTSIFEDKTSKDFTGTWYQCDAVKVRTSGSSVVDKVRSSLSYNDIVVSQNPDLIKGQESRLAEFNKRIYEIITSEVLNISQSGCTTYNDRCIPALRKTGQPDRSRKIDDTFYQQRGDKKCFVLGVVTGNIDCKFWIQQDGLDADVAVVSRHNNVPLKTAVRGKSASWSVYTNDLVDPAQKYTLSYSRVARTLWTRFMDVLASNATLSAQWVRPVSLPFFEHDATYRSSFVGFNLARKLDTERNIKERGNDCGSDSPVIQYDRCSDDFNALWRHAGESVDAHVRQRGPVVVPAKTTLVWPGLSYAHHMADAVPAWSLRGRNATQVFSRWLFDEGVQCKSATIDTTVCADVSTSQVETRIQSVIPWLGGDYNPWEACDTAQSGDLGDGEYANEAIATSCHPIICSQGAQSTFYRNHPTDTQMQCSARNGEMVRHKRNVPSRYRSNLCRRAPELPSQCAAQSQGMLLGLEGIAVPSLYREHAVRHRDAVVAKLGAGLFVHGGNPIYYTAKGTPEDLANSMHAVLRSNPDDLGGHHIILKIFKEAWSGRRSMLVDRIPLVAIDAAKMQLPSYAADPILFMFKESLASNVTTWSTQSGWLLNKAGNMRTEQVASNVDKLHPLVTYSSKSWDCPLRRISFWSKATKDFSPLVPIPGRTARIFGGSAVDMTHGTRSHPTQLFGSLYPWLAAVHTSNGFCFCVDWQDCQTSSGACSLLETVRSMYDRKFRTTQLLTQTDRICTRQLDWPFVGGTMRDGSRSPARYGAAQAPTTTESDGSETCNVIDRLPPFQYRYMPSGKVYPHPDGKTTLDEGGACHMGRAARLPSQTITNTRLCRKIYSNFTHVVARCFQASGSAAFFDVEMEREMSKAPDWMVEHMKSKRLRCGAQQCNAATDPLWKTEFDAQNLPHGPEVSYGIPFRWSSARLLASDLRSIVCSLGDSQRKYHNGTAACDALLNLPAWTMSSFLQKYAGANFSSLFASSLNASAVPSLLQMLRHMQGEETIPGYEDVLQRADDGYELWDGPDAPGWVACNQQNGTCYGKIAKDEWYASQNSRAAACKRTFHEQAQAGAVNSTAAGLDICNLNRRTNDLCQILKAAQGKVFEANCIFVGACAPQVFVYTPGMYSSSNNQFVRSTVASFYEMFKQTTLRKASDGKIEDREEADLRAFAFAEGTTSGDEDRVCPMDNMEWELKTRNEAMKQSCASVQMNSMKSSLMMMRAIVDTVVQTLYILLQIAICVFRMLLPLDDKGQVRGELNFWFQRLLILIVEAIKVLADLMFDVIFSTGPLGSVMKAVLELMCKILDFILLVWNETACTYLLKPVVVPALKFLANIIAKIVYFFRLPEGILDLIATIVGYMSRMRCDTRLECGFPTNKVNRVDFGALPVATRCWADFSPEVDTSNSFSCTASDTCRVSELNYGSTLNEFGFLTEDSNQVVCDSCPLQPGGLVNQFGCDTYTKQCTCNRPKAERTFCTSNQECALGGTESPAMCALVGDFSLGTSYGSMPCNLCPSSQPICLVTDSSISSSSTPVGTCTCMQQQQPLQSCASRDLAMRVVPDASQMCAVTLHTGTSSRSVSAQYDWNFLAAAPCVLISMSNAYCYQVAGYGTMVVGHGVVKTPASLFGGARRLLESEQDPADSVQVLVRNLTSFASGWDHVAEPCATLARELEAGYADLSESERGNATRRSVALGVLDMLTVRECVRWRMVARSVIETLNLTSANGEDDCCSHMFLSMTDFLRVATAHKGVAVELAVRWREVAHALATATPLFLEIQRAFDALKQHAALAYLDGAWARLSSSSNNHTFATSFLTANATEVQWMLHLMREHRRQMKIFDMFARESLYPALPPPSSAPKKPIIVVNTTSNHTAGSSENNTTTQQGVFQAHASRSLLAAYQDSSSVINAYSSLVASTQGFSNVAVASMSNMRKSSENPIVTDTWLEGPFGWPPRYDYYTQNGWKIDMDRCVAVELGLRASLDVFRVVKTYYEVDFASKVKVPPWSFAANAPVLYVHSVSSSSQQPSKSNLTFWMVLNGQVPVSSAGSILADAVLDTVRSVAPSGPEAAAGFFTLRRGNGVDPDALTIGNLVHDTLVCDFDSVMFCGRMRSDGTRTRRNILVCFFVSVLLWLAVAFVASLLPVGGTAAMITIILSMLVLVPYTTIQLAYGIAPTCFPMVPTCIVQDIIHVAKQTLPMRIEWPRALQRQPGCMQDAEWYARLGPGGCQIACDEEPFGFAGWEESLAWIGCLVDPQGCGGMALNFAPRLGQASARFQQVATGTDIDAWHAHQFCFIATLGNSMPWFVLAGMLVCIVGYLLTVPFAMLSGIVQVLVQLVSYTNVE